jgi:hypothetical protein
MMNDEFVKFIIHHSSFIIQTIASPNKVWGWVAPQEGGRERKI